MMMLSKNPSTVYRKVDLDARIEASPPQELTRICLEEAVAAMGVALHSLQNTASSAPTEALSRAHGIALWLARAVDQDNPMRDVLVQFYSTLAGQIRRNLVRADAGEIMQIRNDFNDILQAVLQGDSAHS